MTPHQQPTADDMEVDLERMHRRWFEGYTPSNNQILAACRRAIAAEAERDEYLTLLHAECDRVAALEEKRRRIVEIMENAKRRRHRPVGRDSTWLDNLTNDEIDKIHAIASGEGE